LLQLTFFSTISSAGSLSSLLQAYTCDSFIINNQGSNAWLVGTCNSTEYSTLPLWPATQRVAPLAHQPQSAFAWMFRLPEVFRELRQACSGWLPPYLHMCLLSPLSVSVIAQLRVSLIQ
jgi:hypothetical protein